MTKSEFIMLESLEILHETLHKVIGMHVSRSMNTSKGGNALMKTILQFLVNLVTLSLLAGLALSACSFPSGSTATPLSEADVLSTMVAQTLTAQPTESQPEQPTEPPPDTAEPPVQPATETPTLEPTELPEDVHKEGSGITLGAPNCYDLDEGMMADSGDPNCDFTVRPGSEGNYDLTMFIPLLPARFGFGGVFPQEPAREQCATSPDLSSETETISPLGSLYVCYQTNAGRFGYLLFTEVSIDGVTFTWRTFDPPEVVPTPVATLTPRVDTDIPTGNPDWVDNFDSKANWSPYSDDAVDFVIEDGMAVMTAPEANNTYRFMLSWPDLSDAYLQGTFKTASACTGKDRYGLVVRTSKEGGAYVNYYIFGVSCDGSYYLSASDSEGQTPLKDWTADAAIHAEANQQNILGIRMEGDRLVLFANGERLAELTDDTYDEGKFGLFVGSSNTPDFTVQVSEVAYWDLP
jgi:hypothetical protein